MNTDDYIKLVYKSLKGALTSTEAKKLREWETTTPHNHQLAEEIRRTWNASKPADLPFDIDLETDFNTIQQRIQSTTKVVSLPNKTSRRTWLSWAAAALILIIGGSVFYQNLMPETKWLTLETKQNTAQIELDDGTKIWLNANSSLRYPATFSADNRPVELTGEAYFAVAKEVHRPFSVQTTQTTVTVLGTAFNVKTATDLSTTAVAVREGKVQVAVNNSPQKVIVIANEKTTYDTTTGKLSTPIKDTNLNDLAWQRQRLKFANTPLREVLTTIENHYNITLDLTNKSILNCLLSGSYTIDTDMENVLKNITATFDLSIKKQSPTHYQLTGGRCSQ